jgi:hypothetical protein
LTLRPYDGDQSLDSGLIRDRRAAELHDYHGSTLGELRTKNEELRTTTKNVEQRTQNPKL